MLRLTASTRAVAVVSLFVLATPAWSGTFVHRTFTLDSADLSVATDERGFTRFQLRGAQPWGAAGAPETQALSVLVDLPPGTEAISVRAEASDFVTVAEGVRPAPAQRAVAGPADARLWTAPDAERYARTDWEPAAAAELAHSGFLRGRAMAAVRLQPLQIAPASGSARLARRIDVTVEVVPSERAPERRRLVPAWEASLDRALGASLARGPAVLRQGLDPGRSFADAPLSVRAHTSRGRGLGTHAPTALPSLLGTPVQYLIITNQALEPHFDSLATWKTEKGVPAVVRTTEFIDANFPFGVDRAERIRLFIREAFLQWGVQYVLLGGDTPVIPERFGRTTFFGGEFIATDQYYMDLDGIWNADGDSLFGEGFIDSTNPGDQVDFLPDVYVGRAPVENSFQASIWLNKVLTYEKNPPAGFATEALYFAEVLFPQDWTPEQTISLDGAALAENAINRMKGLLEPTRMYENWMPYDSLGAVELTRLAVIDSLNQGFNLLHHTGHGFRNSMSCGDAALTNPDITPLTNSPRAAGLLYSINCTSAAIEFESIGEEFLLSPSGGSVNNVGSTHFDFPTTGSAYQNEFYDIVFCDSLRNVGLAQALQKIPFVGFANFDNVHRWTQFTLILLGDPEMPLLTADPETISVAHAASYALDDTAAAFLVTQGGVPLENARVCLWKTDELYEVGLTDANGELTLPFRAEQTGSVRLTVTKDNVRHFQADVPVNAASGPALIAFDEDITYDDAAGGTNGNGNLLLDAGETLDVMIPVRNVGGSSALLVSGTLLSLDSRVTVVQGASSYGTIGGGGQSNGAAYRITVSDQNVTDGDEIQMRLRLSDDLGGEWSQDLSLTVRAPLLRMLNFVLDDGGSGDGDQFLDIGETADLNVTLLNLREASARSVSATLEPATSGVSVPTSNSVYGTIGPDSAKVGTAFSVSNASSSDPKFLIEVSDAYGVRHRRRIDFAPPGPPTSVKGIGSATSIQVVWTKSGAADLEGYNVYRSLAQGGPFAKTNFLPTGRTAYFLDTGLAGLTRYYYYVTAVDSSGNESTASDTVSASTNPPTLAGFPIPTERNTPSSPVASDVDGDGDLEVFVGSNVLFGWHHDGSGILDADGTERTSGDFTTQGVYYASAPAIADIDQDGTMDIVAATWDSQQLFVFQPDGSVKPGFPVALGAAIWSSPVLANLDADPELEIVFNSNGNRVFAFNADGTEVIDGDSNPGTNGVFKLLGGSFNFGSPAVADLDGDGLDDLIVPSADFNLYAWRGDGSALPGFPVNIGAGMICTPAIGDIDDDGLLEIAVLSSNNKLNVIQQNGTVQPGFPISSIPATGNSRAPSPAYADMDNDGQHEIVVARTDGQLSIFRHDGTAYPGWAAVRFTEMTSGATESSPIVADIDGNGSLEILIGAEDGQLYGLQSDGQPFAGFPIRLSGEIRGTPLVIDFTGDGNAEILLAGWDQNVYVWTYPGPYLPNPDREWTMFGHDARRTSRLGTPVVVAVENEVAAYHLDVGDGGFRHVWQLPREVAIEGGQWRAFRTEGAAGQRPVRLSTVPAGYEPVGPASLVPDERGWLGFEDFTLVSGASYRYVIARVEAGPGREPVAFGPYDVSVPSTAPKRVFFAPAFPNPARGGQTFAFGLPASLPAGTTVRLELYDVRGARVRTLLDRRAEPGRFSVEWDGRDQVGRSVPGGVYLYRFTAGTHRFQGRVVRLQR